MSPSRSVTRSTCQAPSGPTTRQAPNAPESRKAAPPVCSRHLARGPPRVAGHGEVEVDGLAAEQPVAHGAADDPRVRPGEDVAGDVDRRRHRWCSRGTRPLIAQVTS